MEKEEERMVREAHEAEKHRRQQEIAREQAELKALEASERQAAHEEAKAAKVEAERLAKEAALEVQARDREAKAREAEERKAELARAEEREKHAKSAKAAAAALAREEARAAKEASQLAKAEAKRLKKEQQLAQEERNRLHGPVPALLPGQAMGPDSYLVSPAGEEERVWFLDADSRSLVFAKGSSPNATTSELWEIDLKGEGPCESCRVQLLPDGRVKLKDRRRKLWGSSNKKASKEDREDGLSVQIEHGELAIMHGDSMRYHFTVKEKQKKKLSKKAAGVMGMAIYYLGWAIITVLV
ncbi:unnamed protein product [Chrysoparadoxa australica]